MDWISDDEFGGPHARRTDPDTSHTAVPKKLGKQAIKILWSYADGSVLLPYQAYERAGFENGIRNNRGQRVSDLYQHDYIERVERRLSQNGNPAWAHRITAKGLWRLGLLMRPTLPELPIPMSYTSFHAYKTCPKRFWHAYLKKDIPKEVKTGAQWGGSKAHDALKRRLKLREPLPREFGHFESVCLGFEAHDSIKHLELELGIKHDGSPCDFWDPGVAIRGKLDLACSNSPHALLVDWKTGKPWEDATELKIQALLLQARYPDLTHLTGFYYWLRNGAIGTVHELDPAQSWLMVYDLMIAIAGRLKRVDWPADEGPLCPWCPVPKGIGQPLEPVCAHRREPPQR